MPELPEVEWCRRHIETHALNKPIVSVTDVHPKILEGTSAKAMAKALEGHRFTATRRHGKNLFVALDARTDPWLYFHLGMSGWLDYLIPEQSVSHGRMIVAFQNGDRLVYSDPRLFGTVSLVDDVDRFIADKHLGADALAVDGKTFAKLLGKRKGGLKAVLMDQRCIAGLGNLYVDEILYQTGMHPLTPVQKLGAADLRKLHQAMGTALSASIAVETDFDKLPKDFMLPQRHKKGHCPRCRKPWTIETIAGRTTYYCPRHQILPD